MIYRSVPLGLRNKALEPPKKFVIEILKNLDYLHQCDDCKSMER